MTDFAVPCGSLIVALLIGFLFCSWYFRYRYIIPLEHRIRQLERRLQPPPVIVTAQRIAPVRPRWRSVEQRDDGYNEV